MRKIILTLFVVLMHFISVNAQEESVAIMRLSGVTDIEELDAQEMERLSYYLHHPLKINYAGKSRLISSGLFTQYQVATLLDYIRISGDILSIMELSTIDGFGKENATALGPFISFDSSSLPGATPDTLRRWYNSLIARAAVRGEEYKRGADDKYSFKFNSSYDDRLILNLGGSKTYDDREYMPSLYTGSLTYYGRKYKLILGDYNARFGQGIAIWSGFVLSTYVEPTSFYRKASGLSPINSFTGTNSIRGIAADFSLGRILLSAFVSADNLKETMEGNKRKDISLSPGMNITFQGKKGQFGLTGRAIDSVNGGILSADASMNVKGIDYFMEAAYDYGQKHSMALVGTLIPLAESIKSALLFRYKEKQMHAATVSLSYTAGEWISLKGKTGLGSSVIRHSSTISLDAEYLPAKKEEEQTIIPIQYKALVRYNYQISPSFAFGVRISERYRSYDKLKFRTDARTDIKYQNGDWMAAIRSNILNFRSLGALAYIEAGYKSEMFSAYIRGCVFSIDNWDDRIYVYERDAPGTFNVPAYYGKGTTFSSVIGFKPKCNRLRMRYYLRASIQNKPGKAELKLQCMFDL
jgi:hypothetical protein